MHERACDLNSTNRIACIVSGGGAPENIHLMVYCDADFAGDIRASQSTSGGYLALAGPNTCMPVAACCVKQSVVSHSSTESEIISLEHVLRNEALPFLSFWDIIIELLGPASRQVGVAHPERSLKQYK